MPAIPGEVAVFSIAGYLMKAGHFRKNTVSTGDLNRPRSPEVRKPRISAPQWQLRTATIKTFFRKLRGFANLESAYRSRSSTPQQLKPFKEAPRFSKPQISILKQQIRTNQLNPFETIQGLSNFESAYSSKNFPLKIPISQTASKTAKNPIQAPKAAKKRIKRPKRRKESPKKLKKGEKRG